jgi:hypothetical protein
VYVAVKTDCYGFEINVSQFCVKCVHDITYIPISNLTVFITKAAPYEILDVTAYYQPKFCITNPLSILSFKPLMIVKQFCSEIIFLIFILQIFPHVSRLIPELWSSILVFESTGEDDYQTGFR